MNKALAALRIEKEEIAKKSCHYEEENKALLEKLKAHEEKTKELEEKLEETKKEEAAVVVAVAESTNAKVVKKMASLGVPEGTVSDKVETTPTSTEPTEIYKKFESLSGKDKITFFKANETAILKAMRFIHYVPAPVGQNRKTL